MRAGRRKFVPAKFSVTSACCTAAGRLTGAPSVMQFERGRGSPECDYGPIRRDVSVPGVGCFSVKSVLRRVDF